MEILTKLKTVGYAFAIGGFMFACSQEAQNETNAEIDEVQTETNDAVVVDDDRADTAEVDFRETSAWVDQNTTRAENVTESEWQELKAEYKRREARLDEKSTTWDDKTKQEWQQVKDRWNKTENKVQERMKGTDDVDVDVDVNRR